MKIGKIKPYDWTRGCCLFEGTDDCHCAPTINLYTPSVHRPMTAEEIKIVFDWLADPNTRIE